MPTLLRADKTRGIAAANGKLTQPMRDALTISCPHCGEEFSLAFDVNEGSAEFTIDCEVCCRPMTVAVHVEDGEITGLDVVEE